MTPHEFIAKWQQSQLSERSACHEHFLDLCRLLGQPTPAASDPEGAWYTFERGVTKSDGGHGWADVWMRHRFAWEYKGKHRDLKAAYRQLQLYREDLENPPLLVVCDMDRFEIHTNFTGTAKKVYAFDLAGLAEPANLDVLRKLFTDPEALRPGQTTEGLTRQAAELFGQLADGLRVRGIPAHDAAHFLMKLMFCMFAEDIELLPNKVFTKILAGGRKDPARLTKQLGDLFHAMAHGGDFGADEIAWFNGGLFADAEALDLRPDEIKTLGIVSEFDWSNVEPSIFGTLFERTLDPAKRSQIGAHYTSRADIETLLEPVMMAPLRREWADVKAKCEALLPKMKEEASGKHDPVRLGAKRSKVIQAPKKKPRKKTSRDQFERLIQDFVERLSHVTVLDPACGSGNFLYVALHLLLDLEKEVMSFGAMHGMRPLPHVRPTQLAGIEINPYAQQLAQVVIWIGYLQWMRDNGFAPPSHPVLEPIESIRRMDAILDLSNPEAPLEPEWPDAEFIVGNPPFVGGNKIRAELADEYVDPLFRVYNGRLSAFSDLCCYWFEKARDQVERNKATRAGLLATQGIRGGVNRNVLDRIKLTGDIFFAISDRNWILDGAAVHVSMVGFDCGNEVERMLDGSDVDAINANLTANTDVTRACRLTSNRDQWCYGSQQKASFDISPELGLTMMRSPNAAGCPNSDVIRPSLNGAQILRRTHESFVIDFALIESIENAARYEAPFEYVREHIEPIRRQRREVRQQRFWWLHARPSPRYRQLMELNSRYIVTPASSKYRVFVWEERPTLVDHAAIVFVAAEMWFFGVLHSHIHETWARAQATQVRERESGLRYTASTCFETFPFPAPTDAQRNEIAAAAKELDTLRTNWLNPPEWTRTDILEFPGSADGPWKRYLHNPDARGLGTVRYPRTLPRDADAARELKRRTLTNLYNQRPTWLDLAHRRLDEAVLTAYGWPPTLTDEDLLKRLLDLNLAQSQGSGVENSKLRRTDPR